MTSPSWSTATRAQRAQALAKISLTVGFVLLDLKDAAGGDRALAEELKRCKSDEERERLAFEWFGDLGHSQPARRSDWLGSRDSLAAIYSGPDSPTFRTPDWPGGRLPPFERLLGGAEVRDSPEATSFDGKRGRPEGTGQPIPFDTFRAVVEMALNGNSAREIETATLSGDSHLTFVNRDKAAVIVRWVDSDKAAARRALGGGISGGVIPPHFSATDVGVIVPTRKNT